MTTETENTGEIQGRFRKGLSGNPSGRPRGSLNRTSIMVRELMADEAADITRKLIELAKNGEIAAIKLIIERLLPPIKELHLIQERYIEQESPAQSRLKEILEHINNGTMGKP